MKQLEITVKGATDTEVAVVQVRIEKQSPAGDWLLSRGWEVWSDRQSTRHLSIDEGERIVVESLEAYDVGYDKQQNMATKVKREPKPAFGPDAIPDDDGREHIVTPAREGQVKEVRISPPLPGGRTVTDAERAMRHPPGPAKESIVPGSRGGATDSKEVKK